jgi:hypothetical protein
MTIVTGEQITVRFDLLTRSHVPEKRRNGLPLAQLPFLEKGGAASGNRLTCAACPQIKIA